MKQNTKTTALILGTLAIGLAATVGVVMSITLSSILLQLSNANPGLEVALLLCIGSVILILGWRIHLQTKAISVSGFPLGSWFAIFLSTCLMLLGGLLVSYGLISLIFPFFRPCDPNDLLCS